MGEKKEAGERGMMKVAKEVRTQEQVWRVIRVIGREEGKWR